MIRALLCWIALIVAAPVLAKPLTVEQKHQIDTRVLAILKADGTPSASISIVVDGKLDYVQAYGDQRLDRTAASTNARYPIASISKQFTAAAILLLVEDGKMSLDDKVAKYLPTLAGADTVTVRELLGHTSGYRDYWPQDYRFEAMEKPTTPQAILDRWAKAPLDFVPGSKFQYSNTGYTAAGLIAEMVAKEPLFALEQRRIFKPLGMDVVLGATGLSRADAHGTVRYALGSARPTSGEEAGWAFAAGDLAMTPSELAKWNIARLKRSVLKPASWQLQETNIAPADASRLYGLGVGIVSNGSHPSIRHNGGWTGYHLSNRVYPTDRAAVTVFTNNGTSTAFTAIADDIEAIIFEIADDAVQARALFAMLREGHIDRAQFTDNGNGYFTTTALVDYHASLSPLGQPLRVASNGPKIARGGLTIQEFIFTFADRKLSATLETEPESHRVEQFTLAPSIE